MPYAVQNCCKTKTEGGSCSRRALAKKLAEALRSNGTVAKNIDNLSTAKVDHSINNRRCSNVCSHLGTAQ